MAKVLIQKGLDQYEENTHPQARTGFSSTEKFRSALEAQGTQRLKGAPRRFRLIRPSN